MMRRRFARPLKGGVAALLAAAALWPAPTAAAHARISYPQIPYIERVTWHCRSLLRIAYVALPLDERIAPDDLTLDSDETEAPTPAEARAAEARLAGLRPVQPYRPKPAIWRIRDHDTVIYLFGTIHVLPPGFKWRSAALDRVVATAGTLMVESVVVRSAMPLSEELFEITTPCEAASITIIELGLFENVLASTSALDRPNTVSIALPPPAPG